jgi:hypothetical protein
MKDYRAGEISFEQSMALAIVDDHSAQEAAFYDVPHWQRGAQSLRETFNRRIPNQRRVDWKAEQTEEPVRIYRFYRPPPERSSAWRCADSNCSTALMNATTLSSSRVRGRPGRSSP